MAKGDYSTATRNKELLGKTIAAYTDNVQQTGNGLTINVDRERGREEKPTEKLGAD